MDYLTYEEAGELARVSRSYIRDRVASGELPAIRLGRRVVISRQDLDAFMLAHRVSL